MKLILFSVGLIFFVSPLSSQQVVMLDSSAFKAMEKIQHFSGDWFGNGWIQTGRDKRTFKQTEKVIQKANGTVLVIDGLGLDEITSKTVHEAYAVISYDSSVKKYLMRAFLANGNYIDANIRVEADGTLVWGYQHPQAGEIKYTIRVENGKWDEQGEMNRDGTDWIHFFQMNLAKIL